MCFLLPPFSSVFLVLSTHHMSHSTLQWEKQRTLINKKSWQLWQKGPWSSGWSKKPDPGSSTCDAHGELPMPVRWEVRPRFPPPQYRWGDPACVCQVGMDDKRTGKVFDLERKYRISQAQPFPPLFVSLPIQCFQQKPNSGSCVSAWLGKIKLAYARPVTLR